MTAQAPSVAQMRRKFRQFAAAQERARLIEQDLAQDCSRYASATGRHGLRRESIKLEVGA